MELWVVTIGERYRPTTCPVVAVFDTEKRALACAKRYTTHRDNVDGEYDFSVQRCTLNSELNRFPSLHERPMWVFP